MATTHPHTGVAPPPPSSGPPPANPLRTLLLLDALLMVFSIVFWLLGNPTLAAAAGTGAIALTIDVARRLLAAPQVGSAGPAALAPEELAGLTPPEKPTALPPGGSTADRAPLPTDGEGPGRPADEGAS
jgi:hypothetical protein